MSRAKRARAKERKRQRVEAQTRQAAHEPREEVQSPRLAPVRRRAHKAKVGIGAAALISIGASMGLARVTYAGHSKHAVKTLAIPQALYAVVRQNLLQAGIVAPATAPPDATTSTS